MLGQVKASQADVARICGVVQSTVSRWVSGAKIPEPKHREILRREYGIPVFAWPPDHAEVLQFVTTELAKRAPNVLASILADFKRQTIDG